MILKPYSLWLDDLRRPPSDEWVWAKTLDEFKATIQRLGPPVMVSLDHDLTEAHYGGDYSDGQTGYEAVLWMDREIPRMRPLANVHSQNESAARAMRDRLQGHGFEAVASDFARQIARHVQAQDCLLAIVTNPLG